MLKRPLHKRFSGAVREGRKTTTIRNTPWPVGVPIMLYNWSASPYRSPQHDVAPVIVSKTSPITIEHLPSGQLLYTFDGFREGAALWWTEGFENGHDIDDWFRPLVKRGEIYNGHLMNFSLANDQTQQLEHMSQEHGLTLLDSELSDICHAVDRMREKWKADEAKRRCRTCWGSGQVEIQSGPYYRTCDACGGSGQNGKNQAPNQSTPNPASAP